MIARANIDRDGVVILLSPYLWRSEPAALTAVLG
jgi:hypothetical protein